MRITSIEQAAPTGGEAIDCFDYRLSHPGEESGTRHTITVHHYTSAPARMVSSMALGKGR